jgi:hypothetical protein
MKFSPVRVAAWLLLTVEIFSATSCSSDGMGTGVLEGHVDIGPLQPVARVGEPEPTPSAQVYAEWRIVVFSEDGQREVASGEINSAGMYQIPLPTGVYMVEGKPASGSGLMGQRKQPVEIFKGETTLLDISIDTGIR